MGHKPDMILLYLATWDAPDDRKTIDRPRNVTMRAMVKGVNIVNIWRFHIFFDTVSYHAYVFVETI